MISVKAIGAALLCVALLPGVPDSRGSSETARQAIHHLAGSVIGSAGRSCSSADYSFDGTGGEVVIGKSERGAHRLHAGFWSRGPGIIVGVEPPSAQIWRNALHSIHPNPFNPAATIDFEVGDEERVRVEIFDPSGRRLRVLLDEFRPPGRHHLTWNGHDGLGRQAASGLYLCRVSIGSQEFAGKLLMLK